MITILINKPEFEYDIHSLVKAFYPEEDVKVYCGEEAGEGMVFRIDFEENGMRMRLWCVGGMRCRCGSGREEKCSKAVDLWDIIRTFE